VFWCSGCSVRGRGAVRQWLADHLRASCSSRVRLVLVSSPVDLLRCWGFVVGSSLDRLSRSARLSACGPDRPRGVHKMSTIIRPSGGYGRTIRISMVRYWRFYLYLWTVRPRVADRLTGACRLSALALQTVRLGLRGSPKSFAS
jgi:hypothetical protein